MVINFKNHLSYWSRSQWTIANVDCVYIQAVDTVARNIKNTEKMSLLHCHLWHQWYEDWCHCTWWSAAGPAWQGAAVSAGPLCDTGSLWLSGRAWPVQGPPMLSAHHSRTAVWSPLSAATHTASSSAGENLVERTAQVVILLVSTTKYVSFINCPLSVTHCMRLFQC